MRVLVNGLGCPFTGARYVLDQVLLSAPAGFKITAIVPVVPNAPPFDYPDHVRIIKLKHSVWGMYLRIFLELYINMLMWLRRYDRLINLSNYGLCFSDNQIVYIHNPLLMDIHAPISLGKGNPNGPIRMALKTCLKNARCIFVQTVHMQSQLTDYCAANSIKPPANVRVLRPPFPAPAIDRKILLEKKIFRFQLFYPTSHFPHKRSDLAIEAVLLAREVDKGIGLNITVDAIASVEGINCMGLIPREEVYRQFMTGDAMLFTSERETLGLPLLESIYFEKPVIAPDKEYAREVCGGAGTYYQENNAEAVRDAIMELMSTYPSAVEKTKERKAELFEKQQTWEQHWNEFTTA